MKDYHLKVYNQKSILVNESGNEEVYLEGPMGIDAKKRHANLKQALDEGFLDNIINNVISIHSDKWDDLDDNLKNAVNKLVDSITSENGRAVVGLTVVQLCIKAIDKSQNIRLHKGNSNTNNFSWVNGLPMRSIDKKYFTPFLRNNNLIKLNKDGIMMTRSLAENYPYSLVYKPKIRGAKAEWIYIVELIENDNADAKVLLDYIIAKLVSRRDKSIEVENLAVRKMEQFCQLSKDFNRIKEIISTHIDNSQYGARLLEVAIHSLYQVLEENNCIEEKLSPLSQMRSANKKHKNVGDIEIVAPSNDNYVINAIDAKYGKNYLADELDELKDKLDNHSETESVVFVSSEKPVFSEEIINKINDINDIYSTYVCIKDFNEFVDCIKNTHKSINELGVKWLRAYIESLAQKRRLRAPIDEPNTKWLEMFIDMIDRLIS